MDGSQVKSFLEIFSDRDPSSNIGNLKLASGEKLRRFPQWEPLYAIWEEKVAKNFQISFPLDQDPLVVELRYKSLED